MLGISPLGWVHTLGSLPALPIAIYLLWRYGRIEPRSPAGKAYFGFMVIGAVTVYPLAHSSTSSVLASITLALLVLGFAVRLRPTTSRAALYVETITLSLSVFLLLVPTVTETLRRLPPSHPIAADLTAPVLRGAHLALLVGLLAGLVVQIRALRRGARAPVRIAAAPDRA